MAQWIRALAGNSYKPGTLKVGEKQTPAGCFLISIQTPLQHTIKFQKRKLPTTL